MTAQEPQEAIWLPHPPQGHKVPSPCQGQRLRAVVIQRSPADLQNPQQLRTYYKIQANYLIPTSPTLIFKFFTRSFFIYFFLRFCPHPLEALKSPSRKELETKKVKKKKFDRCIDRLRDGASLLIYIIVKLF